MKKITKKTVKKSVGKVLRQAQNKPVGVVTHYYGGIEVAIVKFSKPVKKGIEVNFKGVTTDFNQKVDSMQYEHKNIDLAKKGQEVGIKVEDKVREGDEVYLVE